MNERCFRIITLLIVQLAMIIPSAYGSQTGLRTDTDTTLAERDKFPESGMKVASANAEYEYKVGVTCENPEGKSTDKYLYFRNIPGTFDYECEGDIPAGKIKLIIEQTNLNDIFKRTENRSCPPGNLYKDELSRRILEYDYFFDYPTIGNWAGGLMKLRMHIEEVFIQGEFVNEISWIEISGDNQPARPDLDFSDTAYIIGDFNDWKLPEGNDLRGALALERTDNLDDIHASPWYNGYPVFPAGKQRFTIYIPPTESFRGGYVMPSSGELTDIPTSVMVRREGDPSDAFIARMEIPRFPYDSYWTSWNAKTYTLRDEPDKENSFRMEQWKGGEMRINVRSSELLITPKRYGEFDLVRKIEAIYEGWWDAAEYSTNKVEHVNYYYFDVCPREYELPIGGGYLKTDKPVDYFGTDILGVTGQSEFEVGPGKQSIDIYFSFNSTKPFKINYTGKREIMVSLDINLRELHFYFPAVDNITDVYADTELELDGTVVKTDSPTEIEVYGISGMMIASVTGTELDLSNLGHGTYIIRAAGKVLKVSI